ncbi:MAG: response regulator transcription factor [Lutibacter sp.]
MTQLKILILEDEFLIAQDIAEIIENHGKFEVKIANTYKQALILSNTWIPNLLLSDINLKGKKKGTDFALMLKKINPDLKIIFITAFKDQKTIQEAKLCCPSNFIIKPFNNDQLLLTIDFVLNQINLIPQANLNSLSDSEEKIIKLIGQGNSSQEISQILNISEKTVRNHRYNIAKKLNLPKANNSLLKWALVNL